MKATVKASGATAFALTALLILGGCSNGSSSSSSGSEVQVFLTDAPAEDIDSFVLTISEMSLVSESGAERTIFSGGTIEEDLLDLQMIQKFIASAALPPDTYVGMKLSVSGITATAHGVPQTVSIAGGSLPMEFEIVFDDPVTLLTGSRAVISLDYDVEESISDGGGDSIVVESVFFADVRTKNVDLSDFEGTVQTVNTPAGTFSVMVMESSGPGSEEAVGTLTVRISSSSVVEREDGSAVEGESGIFLIQIGQTVEVNGSLDGSIVVAESVKAEVEDGGGFGDEPEFEALVTSVAGGFATVSILDLEDDPLGSFAGLEVVDIDLGGAFGMKPELGTSPDAADVVVGEVLEVNGTLALGVVSPSFIELDKTRFRGEVVSSSGTAIAINALTAERTAIAGLSALTFEIKPGTQVTVDELIPIDPADILPGEMVKVKAAWNVDSDSWVALEIELEATDVDGRASDVSSISASGFLFQVDGTDLGLVNPVTLTVTVDPGARILLLEGATETMIPVGSLPSVLASLAPDARVKVEGILTGGVNFLAIEVVLIP